MSFHTVCVTAVLYLADAANPIVPGIGQADPHMHVWPTNPGKVILYATHDCNKGGRAGPCAKTNPTNDLGFYMTDWWVWSSFDLVNWKLETTVLPDTLSWENVNTSVECWATDAASFANGSTYFYLSVGPKQVGVVSSSTPTGPFKDPLGKPLIPIGMVPTYSRDPGVLMDDDGSNYLIFGTFSYYMAKLNPDMISLSEKPRPVKINHLQHKDDKAFLHKLNGVYYLSWGCFYAMGNSPYGPFNYTGSVIDPDALKNTSFASGGGTQDRHGSFFSFKNQTYFTCNDRSHGGGGGFRSSIIAYAHYRRNGTIVPIRIDETGVGAYNVSESRSIEAEEYFDITGGMKQQQLPVTEDNFEVVGLGSGSSLVYPMLSGAAGAQVTLTISNGGSTTGTIELQAKASEEIGVEVPAVSSCKIPPTGGWDKYANITCGSVSDDDTGSGSIDLTLVFTGGGSEFAHLDRITFASTR
jgi:hypothetical protein